MESWPARTASRTCTPRSGRTSPPAIGWRSSRLAQHTSAWPSVFEHAFPEIFTELALRGAELICIPSAVPVGYEYLLELRTRARAQDNQLFVVASNLVGPDGEVTWCGTSMIAGPRGQVLASTGADGPAIVRATLEPAEAAAERRQEPVLVNRRPDLYRHLLARGGR